MLISASGADGVLLLTDSSPPRRLTGIVELPGMLEKLSALSSSVLRKKVVD